MGGGGHPLVQPLNLSKVTGCSSGASIAKQTANYVDTEPELP